MNDKLPHINPTSILKFFSSFASSQLKIGEVVFVEYASISNYFSSIPERFRNDPAYSMKYHNELLKMIQLLVNEGLLSPVDSGVGLEQRFRCNGMDRGELIDYGYYDFLIYGFPSIRENFQESVRPVIVTDEVTKDQEMGTGFLVRFGDKLYFITARHCLPKGSLITIPHASFDGTQQPLKPENIFFPKDEYIDLAIIEIDSILSVQVRDHETSVVKSISFSEKHFMLEEPQILDQVLTMGFPPIPGFRELVQVSETARISANLKLTIGEITGQGQHYFGGKDHFLISARVKGGNSGGPVINRYGLVVGMITELLMDNDRLDLLGYGVAISSSVIKDLLFSLEGNGACKFDFESLTFQIKDEGFKLK
jgi:serine protease Do